MFRVSVRHNSTSPFLSDLLKRVNAVTSRANEIVEKSATQALSLKAKKSKAPAKTAKPGPGSTPEPARLPKSDVQILNHPMRNRFGQNREGEARFEQRGQDGARARGPRGPRVARTNTAKPTEGAAQKRNNAKRSTRGQGRGIKLRTDEKPTIPVKELHAVPLTPLVSGNTFLYGKPVSLVISPSSRAAALAKEALVESKYPYKLPKEVIADIPAKHPNRFILQQSSFSVLVNPEQIKSRYAHMVQGKPLVIDASKAKGKDSQFVSQQILQNGDLSLSQRQLLFDVATGLKLAQEMFKGAAWNK